MSDLAGKTIAVFLDNLYDEREFLYPTIRLEEAGAKVIVVAKDANTEYIGKTGYPSTSEVAFKDIDPDKIDGIVIPGGYAPDHLRRYEECLNIVRKMHEQSKMIAFICHAGWVPISAGILNGVKATCVAAIKDDMINAGVVWQESIVTRDRHIISARRAQDCAAFMKEVVQYLSNS